MGHVLTVYGGWICDGDAFSPCSHRKLREKYGGSDHKSHCDNNSAGNNNTSSHMTIGSVRRCVTTLCLKSRLANSVYKATNRPLSCGPFGYQMSKRKKKEETD